MNIITNLKRKGTANKGITLIALVITIIILLILAGISIAMLTGDNGILNKATTAKEETIRASAEEKVKIAVYGSYNTEGKIDATELKKNLENVEGIDKTTTNIKSLPATVVCDGYEIEITGRLEGMLEPGKIVTESNKEYNNNGTAIIPVGFAIVPGLDDVSEGLVISDVANDTENLGRYETGKDENENAIVKKDKPVYNNIKWGNSMTDSTGGAVELARNFAKEKGYTNVTTTLCYGIQWDATMQFMDSNYINETCNENSYVRNSTGKGNYSTSSIINTGSNEDYKIKNIYDMAGNVWEWLIEAYQIDKRDTRGGSCYSDGNSYPASYRGGVMPITAFGDFGFRIALCIKV